jgi:hypothetical protein
MRSHLGSVVYPLRLLTFLFLTAVSRTLPSRSKVSALALHLD